MKSKIHKMAVVFSIMVLFLFTVGFTWPWSLKGTWHDGRAVNTLCGKVTELARDVTLKIEVEPPAPKKFELHVRVPIGPLSVDGGSAFDGMFMGYLTEDGTLDGWVCSWEDYGNSRKGNVLGGCSSISSSNALLNVKLTRTGNSVSGYKLKGTLTSTRRADECPETEVGHVISVELTKQ